MRRDGGLIGRERELVELDRFIAAARQNQGQLVLIAGEAGAGKTALVEDALAGSGLRVLRGTAHQKATAPYGPLIDVFRQYTRSSGSTLGDSGPLAMHLALLLPELGPPPAAGDRTHLVEAIRDAIGFISAEQPIAIFLDDLHWADSTTLELLPLLVTALAGDPVLAIGAYRSDELPRGHPLRRLRTELRRLGVLRELNLEPLDLDAAALLIGRILGQASSPELATMIQARTQGIPFYIQELTTALASSGRLEASAEGLQLTQQTTLPVPDSIRDAVLLRTAPLSEDAHAALEVAAVVGLTFEIDLVEELTERAAGIEEVIADGIVLEGEPGCAAFRHALVREALYSDIPWTRRRALHRAVALRLSLYNTPPLLLAEHWLAAREFEHARRALVDAALISSRIHAHRDALGIGRRALEIWPDGEDQLTRLTLLDRLGECAQLSGEVSEATRLWREAADGHQTSGNIPALAETQRRLAGAYEVQGAWDRALAARQIAADGYRRAGMPADAATEYLAMVGHLQQEERFQLALDAAQAAHEAAEESQRRDLVARTLGMNGQLRVKMGDPAGIALVEEGLNLALEHELTMTVPELYFRLASALEHSAEYQGARDAYGQAVTFCETHGLPGFGMICLGCLANVLFETGEWDEAERLCRDVLANRESTRVARLVGTHVLGFVRLSRGDIRAARSLHAAALRESVALDFVIGAILHGWALAQVDTFDGNTDAAVERCRGVLEGWRDTDERHYIVPALRWMAEFFATAGYGREARECASALATIAAATGETEALAALAAALGEIAWLEGQAEQACTQLLQAIELLRGVTIPHDRAQLHVRAGMLLAASGQRENGSQHLVAGYRIARKLGAKPVAERAARELAALGEPVERKLGRRAVGQLERAGLSRRELEVLRLIAAGRTNREIGNDLFLSPRTIDMHVGKILAKLDCRSRAEATRRGIELGLVTHE